MRLPSFITLLVVFALGFICALAGITVGYAKIEAGISTLVVIVSLVLIVAIGIGVVVIALGGRVMQKIVGASQTELAAVADPVAAGFQEWTTCTHPACTDS